MATLVVTLGGAAARAERTYTRAEVNAILDLIDQHAAEKAAKEKQREANARAAKVRMAAKWLEALRIARDVKGERARRKAAAVDAAHNERLLRAQRAYLMLGGRAGSGPTIRPRRAR